MTPDEIRDALDRAIEECADCARRGERARRFDRRERWFERARQANKRMDELREQLAKAVANDHHLPPPVAPGTLFDPA